MPNNETTIVQHELPQESESIETVNHRFWSSLEEPERVRRLWKAVANLVGLWLVILIVVGVTVLFFAQLIKDAQ